MLRCKRMVETSLLETPDLVFVLFGTRPQAILVKCSKLMLPGVFDLVSSSFTFRDVTIEFVSVATELYDQYAFTIDRISSRLQVYLADVYQITRNIGPEFPVGYDQRSTY